MIGGDEQEAARLIHGIDAPAQRQRMPKYYAAIHRSHAATSHDAGNREREPQRNGGFGQALSRTKLEGVLAIADMLVTLETYADKRQVLLKKNPADAANASEAAMRGLLGAG